MTSSRATCVTVANGPRTLLDFPAAHDALTAFRTAFEQYLRHAVERALQSRRARGDAARAGLARQILKALDTGT